MPMRIYDFRCPECGIWEAFVKAGTTHVRCGCGRDATRIISPIKFSVDGSDPAWPTAHDKWVREHEGAGKIHKQLHNT